MIKKSLTAAIALAALGCAGAASAVTITFDPLTSTPAANTTVAGVEIVSSDVTNARGWSTSYQIEAGLTVANIVANGGADTNPLGSIGQCTFDAGTRVLTVFAARLTAGEIPAGTACTFDLVVDDGIADGTALSADLTDAQCTAVAGACTTTVTDADGNGGNGTQGHVATVTAVATPLTLSYAPNFGTTITFAGGGLVGASAPDETITVTATGTSGTASLTGCGITGAGAGAFSVTPGSLNFAAAGSQDLTVGCTHAAAASSATLTCTETDADNAAPGTDRLWSLSCPAGGVPDVDPTITSNPTSGSTLTVGGGSIAALGTGTIDFTAAGGSGGGSTTINCTATGGAVVSLSPALPSGTTANQTVTGANPAVDVRVGVTLTSAAQPAAGNVSCVLTGGTNATFTYAIAAPAGSAFTAPAVIPSASTWSKIALFGLLGMFGMLAVAFRRQG